MGRKQRRNGGPAGDDYEEEVRVFAPSYLFISIFWILVEEKIFDKVNSLFEG